MKPKPNHIIVSIASEQREQLFENTITKLDGTTSKLFIDIEEEENFDKSYQQSVTIGEVVGVGAGVKNIHIGDMAVLDYTADINKENILSSDGVKKLIIIQAVTTYKDDTLVLPPNRRTPRPTCVHTKGDIDVMSMCVAVIRDGEIYPVAPYVFLEKPEMEEGEVIDRVVERTVTHVFDGSEVIVGSVIAAENEAIFERSFNDRVYEVVMENDILLYQLAE